MPGTNAACARRTADDSWHEPTSFGTGGLYDFTVQFIWKPTPLYLREAHRREERNKAKATEQEQPLKWPYNALIRAPIPPYTDLILTPNQPWTRLNTFSNWPENITSGFSAAFRPWWGSLSGTCRPAN